MTRDKQYLFPSGGSHFFGCLMASGLMGIAIYDLVSGHCASFREGNVSMDAIMVLLLLVYTLMIEACMMITAKGYLFAYNIDKAMCIPVKNQDLKSAVSIGRRLYGPIFDKNCVDQFAVNPKSTTTRKVFYVLIVLLFFMSLISPCRHLHNAIHAKSWSMNQTVAWLIIFADGMLIVNRIFFRTSIRKLWAYTLGDANFRAVLKFESSKGGAPPYVLGLNTGQFPDYNNNNNGTSRMRLILTGVLLISIVVFALNFQRGCSQYQMKMVTDDVNCRGEANNCPALR